jgi:hypothetical protein
MMRALLALLALLGLFSLPRTPLSAACPQQISMAMGMMHHDHNAPVTHEQTPCALCLAVLPSLPPIRLRAALPAALSVSPFRPLLGIDPTLDPPPPRTA